MKHFTSNSKLRQTYINIVLTRAYTGQSRILENVSISDDLLYPFQSLVLTYEKTDGIKIEITGQYVNTVPDGVTDSRQDIVLDKSLTEFGISDLPQNAKLYYYSSFANSSEYDYQTKADAYVDNDGVESTYHKSNVIQQPQNYHRLGRPGFINGEDQHKLNRLYKYVQFSGIEIGHINKVTLALLRTDSTYEFETRIKVKNADLNADFSFYTYTDASGNLQRYLAINSYEHIDKNDKKTLSLSFKKEKASLVTGDVIYMIRVEALVLPGGTQNCDVDVAVKKFDDLINQQLIGITSGSIQSTPIVVGGSETANVERGVIGFTSDEKLTIITEGQSRIYPKKFSSGDLNDYKTPGYYICTSADSANINNRPAYQTSPSIAYRDVSFELVVLKDKTSDYVLQEYSILADYPDSGTLPEVYRRVFNGTSWGAWKTYAFKDHSHKLEDLEETDDSRHVTTDDINAWNDSASAAGKSKWKIMVDNIAQLNSIIASDGEMYIVQTTVGDEGGIYMFSHGKWVAKTIESLNIYEPLMSNPPEKGLISKNFFNYISELGFGRNLTGKTNAYIHTKNHDNYYNVSTDNFYDLVKHTAAITNGCATNSIALGFSDTLSSMEKQINIGTNVKNTGVGIGQSIEGKFDGIAIGIGLKGSIGVILGKYNKGDTSNYFELGNGFSDANRSNIMEINSSGDIFASKFILYGREYYKSDRGYDILLTDGNTLSQMTVGQQLDIDALYENKLDKGGTCYLKLVSVDDTVTQLNLAYDTTSQIVVTPDGTILVDTEGRTTLPNGISINPSGGSEEYGSIRIPAAISVTGTEQEIEATFIEDSSSGLVKINPIDIRDLYNHPESVYPVLIQFDYQYLNDDWSYAYIQYNTGQKVYWEGED